MPYTPPSLATLRASVARDLRDPTYKTFSTTEVNDLINAGIVEVSRVAPVESLQSVVFQGNQAEYPVAVTDAFRVELYVDGEYNATIPPNTDDDSAQGGWDLFGGMLHVPWSLVPRLSEDTQDTFRVWGYRNRSTLSADNESLEGDADIEQSVRTYALLEGYQRLVNSRALFQQWVQTPGNSDVSPTQLMGFAQTYESQWQRIRQQMRKLRRR